MTSFRFRAIPLRFRAIPAIFAVSTYCRIRGFASEYKKSVMKFTIT